MARQKKIENTADDNQLNRQSGSSKTQNVNDMAPQLENIPAKRRGVRKKKMNEEQAQPGVINAPKDINNSDEANAGSKSTSSKKTAKALTKDIEASKAKAKVKKGSLWLFE
jgi:hypothetical protein